MKRIREVGLTWEVKFIRVVGPVRQAKGLGFALHTSYGHWDLLRSAWAEIENINPGCCWIFTILAKKIKLFKTFKVSEIKANMKTFKGREFCIPRTTPEILSSVAMLFFFSYSLAPSLCAKQIQYTTAAKGNNVHLLIFFLPASSKS